MDTEIRSNIYVDGTRVIGSGSVLANIGAMIRIDLLPSVVLAEQKIASGGMIPVSPVVGSGMTPIAVPPQPIISLELIIENAPELGEASVKNEVVNSNTLRLRIANFENPIGQGVFMPFEIGTVMGKSLKFSFVVYAVGPVGRVLHYTLTLES